MDTSSVQPIAVEGLSLPTIIRNGISGVVALLLFAFFPMSIFQPGFLDVVSNVGVVFGTLAFGLVLGFLFDAMKLYRRPFNDSRSRKAFAKEIGTVLSVDQNEAFAYLAKASQLERQIAGGDIYLLHSKMLMGNVCALLFVMASLLWCGVSIYEFSLEEHGISIQLGIGGIIFFLAGMRLYYTSGQEGRRIQRAWLVFCRDYRDRIVGRSNDPDCPE